MTSLLGPIFPGVARESRIRRAQESTGALAKAGQSQHSLLSPHDGPDFRIIESVDALTAALFLADDVNPRDVPARPTT